MDDSNHRKGAEGLPTIDEKVRDRAKVLWDYLTIDESLGRADLVLALGSHDERVAVHAASLVLMDVAPLLVTSGGRGKVTENWDEPEGEHFAAIARSMGVPSERVIVESTASNTGENIVKVKELLTEIDLRPSSGILVSKPYMSRRARATAEKQWPEIDWRVSPPPIDFAAYPSEDTPEQRMIELLVGDVQRMWVYADQGFQVPEQVPQAVRDAYAELVDRGFDRFVIDGA